MGWVGEGDVEDGRAVYEVVDGFVVVCAWKNFLYIGDFLNLGEVEGMKGKGLTSVW